ncbi:MAG: hypothetical protein II819_08185, partial [Fibrobacter sp.]|nr:hypothetical protein [Fibrobacter sp.]
PTPDQVRGDERRAAPDPAPSTLGDPRLRGDDKLGPGNAPNVKLNVQRAFANAKAQTVEELEERINFQSVV